MQSKQVEKDDVGKGVIDQILKDFASTSSTLKIILKSVEMIADVKEGSDMIKFQLKKKKKKETTKLSFECEEWVEMGWLVLESGQLRGGCGILV